MIPIEKGFSFNCWKVYRTYRYVAKAKVVLAGINPK